MRGIVLAEVLATALLWAAPARADRVGVYTGPDAPAFARQASGLLIPGRGPEVSREEALDALEGIPPPRCPCEYVVLLRVPSGKHANDRRYPIAIAGPGYDGLLVSDRTRVPGLASIYDIKPTVEALEEGREPHVTAHAEPNVQERLDALDARLDDLDDSRTPAGFALAALMLAFAILARARRSFVWARASLLTVPIALTTALALSALEVTAPATVVPILAVVTAAGALVLARFTANRYALAAALLAIFPVYLLVLAISTETSSLAVLGPRPENGGRFYGFNNQLETLVLVPALLGAYLLGARLLPAAGAVAVVTIGASFAGADGGGVLVLLAGFLVLWLRLRGVPLTLRNLALTGAAVVVLGLALVGLDAAFGGESHVTRSIGGGPVQIAGDIGDRLIASAKGVVSTWHSALVVGVSIPVLIWVALRRPRYAALDALLVAIAVSLIVNDAPREVSGLGALSALALRFWHETAERLE
jgi:hypothetical protein